MPFREPIFTVVVPTLGRHAQLSRCLSALRLQRGCRPFNVVVVHNHDGDMGSASYDTSAGDGVSIEHISEPHTSVGRARNAGSTAALTPWVLYTDDDCVVPPSWVDERHSYVSRHPEAACVGGLISEPSGPGCINSFMHRLNYMGSAETMKVRPGNIPSMGCGNLAVRRAALLELGGFNEQIASGEDYEMLVRLRRAGCILALDPTSSPVKHMHVTGLGRFVRRYLWYGRGVAQIVDLHRLDWESHRIYFRSSTPAELLRSAHRFALEDLSNTRCPPGVPGLHRPAHVALAYVRALSWQLGAYMELRRGGRWAS